MRQVEGMTIRAALLSLFLVLPVLASGALYKLKPAQMASKKTKMTASVTYPVVSGMGQAADKVFNAAAKEQARQMIVDFEKEARENQDGASPDIPPASFTIAYATKHASDRLLAVLMTGYEYLGGAHGTPIYQVILADPNTGKRVGVSELFAPKSNYLQELSRLSQAQLKPRMEELLSDENWLAEGTAPKAENFSVIWPSEKGLVLTFTPYQVAPYAAGAVQITLPYDQLGGLLSDRFFDN